MKTAALVSLMLAAIAMPAMATSGLVTETNKDCDNATLSTYDGDVNLTADWSANTINLTWYNDSAENNGTVYNSNQCTYDGGITLPVNTPTKTGYTFVGWRVRHITNPLRNFDININGTLDKSRRIYDGLCWNSDNSNDCDDLSVNEYKVEFSYGVVYGQASCQPILPDDISYIMSNLYSIMYGEKDLNDAVTEYTSIAGSEKANILESAVSDYKSGNKTFEDAYSIILNNLIYTDNISEYTNTSVGQYCFCRIKGFKANNVDEIQNLISPSWVFDTSFSGPENCEFYCSNVCADATRFNSNFRKKLYSIIE